jgi:23S rRNA (cytidine1920-2'-O)/16S rRNA (cytidine1409-2'-O)-methyltransferase
LKLQAALETFDLDPAGLRWADLGCNVGGFTDCLLQRGARSVHAVDTGYGQLAWTLRNDPRVVVLERTNALHFDPPGPVDAVAIDVAWTPQKRIVPAAGAWLDAHGPGWIVSLLKPHYELAKLDGAKPRSALDAAQVQRVLEAVTEQLARAGWSVAGRTACPIAGKGGNIEWLLWILPAGRDVDEYR